MDPNNNPDDDTVNRLKMVKFKQILTDDDDDDDDDSVMKGNGTSSISIPMNGDDDKTETETETIDNRRTTGEFSSKRISIAWNNLRFEHPDDQQSKLNNCPFSFKYFLLLHRRGSVATPQDTTTTTTTTATAAAAPAAPANTSSSSTTPEPRPKYPVLRRLTGYFEYQTINALLGPSSHARLTFLQCLTGLMSCGLSTDSSIYLNPKHSQQQQQGVAWIPRNLKRIIFPKMFVGEILRYGFLFQNGFLHWSRMMPHIRSILEDLLLEDEKILHKRFDQCSSHEQRRIAIAQQLMNLELPTFLFLHEPFAEIDSWSSQKIMQSLKSLTQKHQLTITISASNTPNVHLLHYFDKLYILAHGGVCIYSGPPRLLAQALRPEMDPMINDEDEDEDEDTFYDTRPPVEEMLKISCLEFTHAQVRKLANQTLVEEHRKLFPHLNQLAYKSRESTLSRKKRFSPTDLFIHLFRHFRLLIVNQWFLWRLLFTILYHVFLWYFLVDQQMTSAHGCYDPVSKHMVRPINRTRVTTCEQVVHEQFNIDNYVTYQMYSMWFLASMATTTTSLIGYRMLRVFQNEHQNRHYSLGVFITSSTIIQLVSSVFWSLLSAVLVYCLSLVEPTDIFRTDLWKTSGFNLKRLLHFWLFYWLLYVYHQSYGFLLSAIFNHKHQYTPLWLITTSQVIVLLFQLFSNNILVIVDRINFWLFRLIGNHLIGLRHLYDGVFQSFYGLGRCDSYLQSIHHRHYNDHLHHLHHRESLPRYSSDIQSIMFQRYSIQEPPTNSVIVFKNLLPVVIFCLVIRVLTIIILWFRFYLNHNNCPVMEQERKQLLTNLAPTMEMIPIDYGMNGSSRKKSRVRIIQPIFKDDEEVEFCRDKIHLAWRSLSLFATAISATGDDMILRDLNGQFNLGTMNAVIGGQSRSTRTALLRVLSGHLKTRICPGARFYESQYINTNFCFISVDSHEHLVPGLTVKQTLIYASIIKNIEDDYDGRLDHEEMALNILDELNLRYSANDLVEDCTRYEQKRLALAQELTSLQMPNLILMDNPTDGLDVITSELLVKTMRDLTERHSITFIASFHQTNHQVFSMFDQLYCLNQNGRCIYSGAPTANHIRKHLLMADSTRPIKTYPLELLIEYSCVNDPGVVSTVTMDKMVQNHNQKIAQTDPLLEEDAISLKNGIKSNVMTFSVIAAMRLSKRYQARWISTLWFRWIIYTSIYLLIALMLNGLFGAETTKPDGCVRMDVFNGTHSCPQHRTGTKMIWDEDGHRLWDNYRYIHLANHLFLLFVLFHSSFVFYQELKIFCYQHQNGWFSTAVFHLNHNLLMDLVPMIPVVFLYLYIIDYNRNGDVIKNSGKDGAAQQQLTQQSSTYWWSVILLFIATKSMQYIGQLIVIIFGQSKNRYELSINILLITSALLFITSNFHIRNRFTLSFLNIFKYLDEATLVLIYGAKYQRCSMVPISTYHQNHSQSYVSLILHRMDTIDANAHFSHCFKILICQALLFRFMSGFALLLRTNADRIFRHHRLWSSSDQESESSYLSSSSLPPATAYSSSSSSAIVADRCSSTLVDPPVQFTGPSSSSSLSSPTNADSSDHLEFDIIKVY